VYNLSPISPPNRRSRLPAKVLATPFRAPLNKSGTKSRLTPVSVLDIRPGSVAGDARRFPTTVETLAESEI
jgi:hypothetical protein